MPVHKASDHPTYEMGGNTIIGLAAPSRGTSENILFRAQLPPGGSLPRHRHDHEDVFTVVAGTGAMVIAEDRTDVEVGDAVIVPTGEWHHLEAGPGGVEIIVTMDAGTLFILEDGSERVPPWGE